MRQLIVGLFFQSVPGGRGDSPVGKVWQDLGLNQKSEPLRKNCPNQKLHARYNLVCYRFCRVELRICTVLCICSENSGH